MNKVIQDIEDLEKIIIKHQDVSSKQESATFCIARAILKLALVHAGNNVETVYEKKHEINLDMVGLDKERV